MGELQALKTHVCDSDELGRRLSEQLSGEIGSIQSKLGDLEVTQVGVSPDSMGDEAAAIMGSLNSRINQLQAEINDLKVGMMTVHHMHLGVILTLRKFVCS